MDIIFWHSLNGTKEFQGTSQKLTVIGLPKNNEIVV